MQSASPKGKGGGDGKKTKSKNREARQLWGSGRAIRLEEGVRAWLACPQHAVLSIHSVGQSEPESRRFKSLGQHRESKWMSWDPEEKKLGGIRFIVLFLILIPTNRY